VLASYRQINQGLWEAYQRGEITPPVLSRERFRRLLEHLGRPTTGTRRLAALYIRCMAARGDLRAGSRPLLRRLGRRFLLGTVTNGLDRVARSRLRAARIHELFDTIVTSQGCGFAKPDPRIVHHALARLRVAPQEAVLVGDDPRSDGGAAAGAGVRFLWVDHGQKLRPGTRPPRHRVRRWADLLAFLNRL
jgi:HAD superfamily hydrolase (TIGR01509 family)